MITRGLGTPRDVGGGTGNQVVSSGAMTVRISGVREMASRLEQLGARMGEPKALEGAVKAGAELIKRGYKSKINNVTGNLSKSVRIETKSYDSAVVAIVGPWQSGRAASREGQESGNIAWIYEFGTGPRKPGSQSRRAYINVHQSINGRMRRHSSANDEQFARMGRGYYFLMGSVNVPGRETGKGSFVQKAGGGTRPFYLASGETYPAMPRSDAMQKTVSEQRQAVLSTVTTAIQNTLARLTQ
jgi:hypothetical protein